MYVIEEASRLPVYCGVTLKFPVPVAAIAVVPESVTPSREIVGADWAAATDIDTEAVFCVEPTEAVTFTFTL